MLVVSRRLKLCFTIKKCPDLLTYASRCMAVLFPIIYTCVCVCVCVCIYIYIYIYQFSSIQSLSRVRLFATPWTAARRASLSITNSQSLLKLMSIESVMPSNHLILCRPLLFLPSVFPSIRFFSSESVLLIRWPKYWSFSFSISPSNEHSGLTSFTIIYILIFLWVFNNDIYYMLKT